MLIDIGAHSAFQGVKRAYTEETRELLYLSEEIEPSRFDVFAACVKEIDEYNAFAADPIIAIARAMWDKFHWRIGREYSPVIIARHRLDYYDIPTDIAALQAEAKESFATVIDLFRHSTSTPDEFHFAPIPYYQNSPMLHRIDEDTNLREEWPCDTSGTPLDPLTICLRLWWD